MSFLILKSSYNTHRTLYAYLLGVGYVFHYRAYWDSYTLILRDTDRKVLVSYSLIGFIWNYTVTKRAYSFNHDLPFNVDKHRDYENYFIQGTFFRFKNVRNYLNQNVNIIIKELILLFHVHE